MMTETWIASTPQRIVLRHNGKYIELPTLDREVHRVIKIAMNAKPEEYVRRAAAGELIRIATFEVDEDMTAIHGGGAIVFYAMLHERDELAPVAPPGKRWAMQPTKEVKVWR